MEKSELSRAEQNIGYAIENDDYLNGLELNSDKFSILCQIVQETVRSMQGDPKSIDDVKKAITRIKENPNKYLSEL